MSTTDVLERIVAERDEVRSAAIHMAEADDFSPSDKTFTELQERASELDKRAATLAELINQQQSADQLDAKFSKAQKRADERASAPETRDSWGETFVRSDAFAAYPGRGTSGKVEVEMRALPHTLASMADGLPSVPVYDMTPPAQPPSLLPLVNVVNVSQNSVDYVTFTKVTAPPAPASSAKIAPEGTDKAEIEWEIDVSSASLVTVAGYTAYSRQLASDAAAIVSYINGELRNEVSRKIEEEAQAALAAATLEAVTGDDLISALRLGMARVQANGFVPNGFTASPDDLAAMDLAAVAMGGTSPVSPGSYWGLRPVIDWTKEAGDGLHVGDFRSGIVHYRRTNVELFTTDSHADFFRKNLLASIAEARCLTKVVRAAAIVTATAA